MKWLWRVTLCVMLVCAMSLLGVAFTSAYLFLSVATTSPLFAMASDRHSPELVSLGATPPALVNREAMETKHNSTPTH